MTIKELENRTGMTRANIRFYEGEGLLSPRRLENGYRDYSEEDVRTLEKIKLLRRLQMDLDTIRLVQQGGLTLEQALFSQLTRLEGDKTVIERAAQVCRELEQSGVEYGALEPEPWLRQLSEPPRPAFQSSPPRPPLRQEPHYDVPRACYYPWRRLFARGLDMMLYSTVFELAWLLITWDQSILNAPVFLDWVLATLALAFTLAVEPLWLHFWGWTPGKWVFGLKVRDRDGNRLTLAQGWRRSREIFGGGYCWNFPIANLIVMWKCRRLGLDGMDCAWDADEGYRYTREERRVNPAVVYLLAAGVCTGLTVLATLQTNMPMNRGSLTVAEFVQNYNHYYHQSFERAGSTVPTLDREGHWTSGQISAESGGYETFNGVPVRGSTFWEQPEFTVKDGRVVAVTLRWVSDYTYLFPDGGREVLAVLALSGSVDGLNLFNYDIQGWAEAAYEIFMQWGDFETDCRGLHISQKMEYSGYHDEGNYLLAVEGERQHCEMTVTISLIE